MNVSLEIPDDVASRMAVPGTDLTRRALEAFAAEEYRQGRIYKPDLRRLLGFETSHEIDAFLYAHEIWYDYTIEDLDREMAALDRLGL
ncbi:hypothetical protein F183_A37290 [Bryobacterales bacterium F-183]|nr:hypothetical protein F183_A37290 [Bryobacterales bacterium F-183]